MLIYTFAFLCKEANVITISKHFFKRISFVKPTIKNFKKRSIFFLKYYITVLIRYFFDNADPYNFKESFDFYRKVGFTKNLFWKSRFLRWWLHLFQGLALLLHSIFLVTYLHFFTSFYMAVSGTVRGCKCSTEWAWTSGERSCHFAILKKQAVKMVVTFISGLSLAIT